MTDQIPDICTFEGRKWSIDRWKGNHSCVPSNEELRIRTASPHTANWSGRIDHFLVWNKQLYLLKVQANLKKDMGIAISDQIRREVLVRYEPMQHFDDAGERTEVREYRFEYLLFDDLSIPFTGALHLSGPYYEDWDIPGIATDHEPESSRAILVFDSGKFVSYQEIIEGSDSEQIIVEEGQ